MGSTAARVTAPPGPFEAALIESVKSAAARVPPYPGVALRLQQLISSNTYSTGEVASLISSDQVLAAAALRAANAVAYHGLGKVTALPEAVTRLGGEELQRISMAAALGGAVTREGPLADLRRLCWRRGTASALISKLLAGKRGFNAQEAFACGLLHDFGWVVGLAALEDVIAKAKDVAPQRAKDWLDVVSRVHIEFGALVADQWNLSPLLREVIACHHRPEAATAHRKMIDLVNAADAVARLLDLHPVITEVELSGVGLSADEVQLLLQHVPHIPLVLEALSVTSASGPATSARVVTRPETVLTGEVRELAVRAEWVREPRTVVRVVAGTADGLRFIAPLRPDTHRVLLLRLPLSPPLDLFVNVLQVTPAPDGVAVEAKLFALSRAVQGRWAQVLQPATPEGGAP